jgi:hypothetical protein
LLNVFLQIANKLGTKKKSARQTLSYDNESWTIRGPDERNVISAELLFVKTAGYTLSVIKEIM